jgi:PKD domain
LKVTEAPGDGADIATQTVIVNAPPAASFTASPGTPLTGDEITFASTSVDPDGPITHEWDTDDDGAFDDGSGAVSTRKFAADGSYAVRLRVRDDRGASSIAEGFVKIARRPVQAVLSAKPTVIGITAQIAGRTTKRGARITLLRVRVPVGALVKLTCRGKRCPDRSKRVQAKRPEVRFKKFERRMPAGTKLVLEATLDGFIGRQVVFKVRKGKSPKRTDRCIQPGATRPSACPAA